ncbi:MAG: O-antigen ligase family protein [Candidatus Coprovivens sp.]
MKKFKDKFCTKETIYKCLMLFLILQPVLDIYILFKPEVADFFGFSPATIIRILFIGVLGLLFLFTTKFNKKYWWFVVYGALVVLYTVFHHINALEFNSVSKDGFGYNFVSELFYLIRMLMPLFMIVLSAHYKFEDKKVEKLITWLVVLLAGSIVVTNLLGISLGSYSKVQIEGNIFQWFNPNNDLDYMDFASKGFFNDPNRISALMVLITPLLFYVFVKNPNKKNGFLLILQCLGMYMLGTKVAVLGFFVLLFASICIYLYFVLIKKELTWNKKIFAFFMIFFVAAGTLLYWTPAIDRTMIDQTREENHKKNVKGERSEEEKKIKKVDEQLLELITVYEDGAIYFDELFTAEKDMTYVSKSQIYTIDKAKSEKILNEFIEENYLDFSINPEFILNSYPYENDPYFWYKIMKWSLMERTNFRMVERAMLERVKTINANPADNYLGITFTRMSNIFDLERDFLSHYYTLGLFGLCLFLFPYLIIFFLAVFMMLYHYKEKFTFRNVMLMLGIAITLFAAYYSGNCMDGLVVTLILGFVIGQLVEPVFAKKKLKTK